MLYTGSAEALKLSHMLTFRLMLTLTVWTLTSLHGGPPCMPGQCRAAAAPRRGTWRRCAWGRSPCGWPHPGRWRGRLHRDKQRFTFSTSLKKKRSTQFPRGFAVCDGDALLPSSSCMACFRRVWTRRSSSSSSWSFATICSSLRQTYDKFTTQHIV